MGVLWSNDGDNRTFNFVTRKISSNFASRFIYRPEIQSRQDRGNSAVFERHHILPDQVFKFQGHKVPRTPYLTTHLRLRPRLHRA